MNTKQTYEAKVMNVVEDLRTRMERINLFSRVPNKAVVRQFQKKYLKEFLKIHTTYFPVNISEVKLRLSGKSSYINYDIKLSKLLLLNERLLGIFICYQLNEIENSVFVYGIAIKKEWRNTWVAPLLKHSSFIALFETGIEKVQFQILNDSPDTINHYTKVNSI